MSTTSVQVRPWRIAGVGPYLAAVGADTGADALFYLALGWVAARAGSALDAAAIIAAGTIPRVAVMLAGGVVGDRYGLARVGTITLAVRGGLMLAFVALLTQPELLTPLPLSLLAGAVGLADALHMPAMGGLAGLIAPEGAQAAVQGLVATVTRVATVAATAGGGLLLAWERSAIGWAAAALLLAAFGLLWSLRPALAKVPGVDVDVDVEVASFTRMLTAGLAQVRRDRVVLLTLLLFALANLAATAPVALGMPLKAAEFSWSASTYGLAYLGFAAGSALGAITAARFAGRVRDNLTGALVLLIPGAGALLVLALAATPVVAGTSCFTAGLFFAPAAALMLGEIRERTPRPLMGRVSSVIQLSIFGLIPVGHLLFGALVAGVSLTVAGLVMAAGLVVAVGVVAARQARVQAGLTSRPGERAYARCPRTCMVTRSSSRSSSRWTLARVAGTKK